MQNQNEALQVLIGGIEMAQSKGVYSLEESANLWNSIKTFFPKKEEVGKIEKPIKKK